MSVRPGRWNGDTHDNINLTAPDLNSDIIAGAALPFWMSGEIVNGKKGKGNFKQKPTATTTTTVALATY